MDTAIVVIPSYEPTTRLIDLITEVRERGLPVLVVDDGSGAAFGAVFREAAAHGATVIAHEHNRGKGAALKTACAYLAQTRPHSDVVTADADGQHTPTDIIRIADALAENRAAGTAAIVLGCRAFDGDVPWRSRFGNSLSRRLFRVAAGWSLSDTQTGLRGIPASMLAWMAAVPGERFEFEQNVLLHSHRDGKATREVPIETVYLEENASSHFRPVVDSVRVMLPVLLFAGASFLSFLVDTLALLIFQALLGAVVPSVIAARVVSAAVNFALNRRFVFRADGHAPIARQAVRYGLLAVAVLLSNIAWMSFLTDLGVPLLLAKVITELALFALGYRAQRGFVFGAGEPPTTPAADALTRHSKHIATSTDIEPYLAATATR